MDDFLWRQMSDKEKEEVKKQVDSIIDSFSKKLSQIKQKIEVDNSIEREKFEREENSVSLINSHPTPDPAHITLTSTSRNRSPTQRGNNSIRETSKICELDKRIMFENAPEANKDFIIAEKKKW